MEVEETEHYQLTSISEQPHTTIAACKVDDEDTTTVTTSSRTHNNRHTATFNDTPTRLLIIRLKAQNPLSSHSRSKRANLKTELTSFDVAAIVHELNQTIIDARIENIYQINQKTLLLRLHKPNQPALQLLIEAGRRTHPTSYVLTKPTQPPAFCMALRKHLRNGKIQTIEQHEFERTIIFKVSAREGVFQLIIELFGEGNIILVNAQGSITLALSYRRMRDRNIVRNESFKQAPSSGNNPFRTSRNQLDHLRDFGKLETVRALTKFLSIGGQYAEELLLRASVDKNTICESLTEPQLTSIYAQLQVLLSYLTETRLDPAIIIDEKGEWIDVTPIRLRKYEGLERKPCNTFSDALDEYYAQRTQFRRVSAAEEKHEQELAKQQRMLEEQQRTLEDSEKALKKNKVIGDLIYAHFGELQLLLQGILEDKQEGKSWEQIVEGLNQERQAGRTPPGFFDSLDSKNMTLNVNIEGNVFPIRLDRSVQANAAVYYERMKKAERKLEGAEKARKETQARIQELEQLWTGRIEEVQVTAPSKQLKKAWYEKFRWFHSSDGLLVVAGKDATTNEILIKKHLEPQDLVFHADIVGAPFVVVKTEARTPSGQTILEAAQFAASYSRAWREMLNAIDVYWVNPAQISKTPPSGQYVEKGSFVIQGAKNYVRAVPLRVGVGLGMREGQLSVIWGPAEMVSKQTSVYVTVTPGKLEGKVLVSQIRRFLAERALKDWRERIFAIPNEQFQSLIPFGRGEVILK